jgi:hypothetical protein
VALLSTPSQRRYPLCQRVESRRFGSLVSKI